MPQRHEQTATFARTRVLLSSRGPLRLARRFGESLYRHRAPYLFLAPAILFFGGVWVYPVVRTVQLSFRNWDFLNPPSPAGFSNYLSLLSDPLFANSLRNTLFYCLSIPLVVILSMLVAVGVNSLKSAQAVFRSAYFMSTAISFAAAGIILRLTMQKDFGIINWILGFAGIPPVPWLQNPWWARTAVVMVTVWKNLGWYMVVFLAGLQSIDSILYDAAAIDGADLPRRFWHITIPGLRPVIVFASVMAAIDALLTFPQVMALTIGGPAHSTEPILYFIYREAFKSFNVGYAAAASMVLFVLVLLVSIVQIRVLTRRT